MMKVVELKKESQIGGPEENLRGNRPTGAWFASGQQVQEERQGIFNSSQYL